MIFDSELIHPYQSDDLIRIGQHQDGGYVINNRVFEHTDILIGLGINADWSFEEDFARHAIKDLNIYGYDFSVSKEIFHKEYISRILYLFSIKFLLRLAKDPQKTPALLKENYQYARNAGSTYRKFPQFFDGVRNRFFQVGISNEKTAPFIRFNEVVTNIQPAPAPHSIFLKIDIELSEFRIMDDVLQYGYLLSGMAIEFHELDIMWDQFSRIMQAAQKDFIITHVHGNNYSGLIPGTQIPKALEISFIHKSLGDSSLSLSKLSYPLPGLDFPNDPNKGDLSLPFSHF